MTRFAVIINRPSKSAKVLAEALGCKRVRPERIGIAKATRRATLINWGCTEFGRTGEEYHPLNLQQNVRVAKDKLLFLNVAVRSRVSVPDFWQSKSEVPRDCIILARRSLTGSGGAGIVVVRPGEELPDAPLYTRYIPKEREYRVHVVDSEVIFIQQ